MAKIYARFFITYTTFQTHFGAFDTDQIRAKVPEFKDYTDEQLEAMLQDSDHALEMVEELGTFFRVDCLDHDGYNDIIVSSNLNDLDILPDPKAGAYAPKVLPDEDVEKLCENPPSLDVDSQDGERFLEEVKESQADKREPEAREDSGA